MKVDEAIEVATGDRHVCNCRRRVVPTRRLRGWLALRFAPKDERRDCPRCTCTKQAAPLAQD